MTNEDRQVRLVLLGAASAGPVCDGDVCYLPESTVDSELALDDADHHDRPSAPVATQASTGAVPAP